MQLHRGAVSARVSSARAVLFRIAVFGSSDVIFLLPLGLLSHTRFLRPQMPEHSEFVWTDGRTAEYCLDDDGGFRGDGWAKLLELLKFAGVGFGTIAAYVMWTDPVSRRNALYRELPPEIHISLGGDPAEVAASDEE